MRAADRRQRAAGDAVLALDALLRRRRQLRDMLAAEPSRPGRTFGRAGKAVTDSLKAHIAEHARP